MSGFRDGRGQFIGLNAGAVAMELWSLSGAERHLLLRDGVVRKERRQTPAAQLINQSIHASEQMSISATRPRSIAADYSDFPTRRNFTIKGFLSHWIQLAWSSQFWHSAESCMSKLHIMRARMRRISRYARLSFRQRCCSCGEGRREEGRKEGRK